MSTLNSVQNLHTFKLKSNAKKISIIEDVTELNRFVGKANGKDFVVLGEGSNTIFMEDFSGEVVRLDLKGKAINETETDYFVTGAASENWHNFIVWLLENDVYGLENLALIPGTVGASPIQNIGAYGVEVKDFIFKVEYFDLTDGNTKSLVNEECLFGYRDSVFKQNLKSTAVITNVTFKIPKTWIPVCTYGELAQLNNPSAKDIFDKVVSIRGSKLPDPSVLGNAGSFFKNPIVERSIADEIVKHYADAPIYPTPDNKFKLAAGWLIDKCGLKGFELGGIAVHDKQALVLVNKSGVAQGKALKEVILKVQNTVFEKFAVVLETEVRLIGSQGEIGVESREQ